MKILAINCNPDLSYFSKRGLKFTLDLKTDTTKMQTRFLYKMKDQNNVELDMYTPIAQPVTEKYTGYDIIIVGWKPEDYGSELKNTGGYSYYEKDKNGTFWCTVRQDPVPNNNYVVHELHHVLCRILLDKGIYDSIDYMDTTPVNGVYLPYYKNDQPESPDSNHAITWSGIKKYLDLLNNYNKPMWKYFKPTEKTGSHGTIADLDKKLVTMLDLARGIAGIPFVINSGYRTPEHNKAIGGVADSAHIKRLAVDIRCRNSNERFIITSALLQAGFKRIGLGSTFIHCDIDTTKPQNVIFDYDN